MMCLLYQLLWARCAVKKSEITQRTEFCITLHFKQKYPVRTNGARRYPDRPSNARHPRDGRQNSPALSADSTNNPVYVRVLSPVQAGHASRVAPGAGAKVEAESTTNMGVNSVLHQRSAFA